MTNLHGRPRLEEGLPEDVGNFINHPEVDLMALNNIQVTE